MNIESYKRSLQAIEDKARAKAEEYNYSIDRMNADIEKCSKEMQDALISGDEGKYLKASDRKRFAEDRLKLCKRAEPDAYYDREAAKVLLNSLQLERDRELMPLIEKLDTMLSETEKLMNLIFETDAPAEHMCARINKILDGHVNGHYLYSPLGALMEPYSCDAARIRSACAKFREYAK